MRGEAEHKGLVRYATSGDAAIAYHIVGQGALDLVLISAFPSNLEILWEDPGYRHLVKRLAGFARLILFDRRGMGLSDRAIAPAPDDLTSRVDDLRAVLDAAGCGRAALLALSDGVPEAVRFAAAAPARVRALILCGGSAAPPDAKRRHGFIDAVGSAWGRGATLSRMAAGRAEERGFAEWWGRLERHSATPPSAVSLARRLTERDAGDALRGLAVPTLVLHRAADGHVDPSCGRQLARAIANASFALLSGRDHLLWAGDVDEAADLIEEFLTGQRPAASTGRALAAALTVRIMGLPPGSGARTDRRHIDERIDIFREAAGKLVDRHEARARWATADRLDVSFSGVSRAVRAALGLADSAASLGLALAQGIHAGEVDLSHGSLPGPVHETAARIALSARQPAILLSDLACELATGSGLQVAPHGVLPREDRGQPLAVFALTGERHLEPVTRTGGRAPDLDVLSPREAEVLALLADGLSNAGIAVQLGLSEHTVKRHVANILLKLGLPGRAAVAALAARQTRP